jgi:hypothetical protein
MAAAQPHAQIVDVDGHELVYRQWGRGLGSAARELGAKLSDSTLLCNR